MLSDFVDRSFNDSAKLSVALLAGGVSAEREVSLASGRCVRDALSARDHRVTMFDPADVELFDVDWGGFDVCFIALHGGAGENGLIQLQLEEIGIPYTSSSPAAARLAMSKSATKQRLRQYDIPTPDWSSVRATAPSTDSIRELVALGLPAVVKPDSQGSSLGVRVVGTPDEVADAIAASAEFESFVIAERMIAGRELTVAVLDGRPLPVLEIEHDHAVFDYRTKTSPPPGAVRSLAADDPVARRAAQLAVETDIALGTRGLVRVDMMLDPDGRLWVLELNSVPGLTSHSLSPLAARHAGLSMADLCEAMITTAVTLEAAL